MSLRVPTSTTYSRLERSLSTSLGRVQDLQGQLSSGSRINKLSDDPAGAATGMRLRAQETDWTAYQGTADDAKAILATTDSTLQQSSILLTRVRELAISSVSGALGPEERAAIGAQVADLRSQLLDLANTTHLGRAVFGGHQANAVRQTAPGQPAVPGSAGPPAVAPVPATPPTFGFVGDSGVVSRQVSPSVTLAANVPGQAVFGFDQPPVNSAPQDVFSVLGRLELAVRDGNNAAIAAEQAGLATRTSAVLVGMGEIGAKMNRVTTASELGSQIRDRLLEHRSEVEDVDLAAAIVRMQAAQNSYTAALGAVARADLPSLANFLR